ncbi:MAG TPA: hypothetical protein DCY20_03155 [Firmicutes bacterium]|nr:hypothetical protein [Bacillota bacterium]
MIQVPSLAKSSYYEHRISEIFEFCKQFSVEAGKNEFDYVITINAKEEFNGYPLTQLQADKLLRKDLEVLFHIPKYDLELEVQELLKKRCSGIFANIENYYGFYIWMHQIYPELMREYKKNQECLSRVFSPQLIREWNRDYYEQIVKHYVEYTAVKHCENLSPLFIQVANNYYNEIEHQIRLGCVG